MAPRSLWRGPSLSRPVTHEASELNALLPDEALDGHHVPTDMVDPRTREVRLRSWLRQAQELAAVRVIR